MQEGNKEDPVLENQAPTSDRQLEHKDTKNFPERKQFLSGIRNCWPYLRKEHYQDYRMILKIRQIWVNALSSDPKKSDDEIFKEDITYQNCSPAFLDLKSLTQEQYYAEGYLEYIDIYNKKLQGKTDYFKRLNDIDNITNTTVNNLFRPFRKAFQIKTQQLQQKKIAIPQKFQLIKRTLQQTRAKQIQRLQWSRKIVLPVIKMRGFYLEAGQQIDYFIISRLAQMWIQAIIHCPHKMDDDIFQEDLTYQRFQYLYDEKRCFVRQKYTSPDSIKQRIRKCDQYFANYLISRYFKIEVFLQQACGQIFSKTQKEESQDFIFYQEPDAQKIRDKFNSLKSLLKQKCIQGVKQSQYKPIFTTPLLQWKQRLRMEYFQNQMRLQQQQRQDDQIMKKLSNEEQIKSKWKDYWDAEFSNYSQQISKINNQQKKQIIRYEQWREDQTKLLMIKLQRVVELQISVIQKQNLAKIMEKLMKINQNQKLE